MAQLIVRNLSDRVVKHLKERAVKHGRSAEEEHRVILQSQLLGKADEREKDFKEHLMSIPDAGNDKDFTRRNDKPRKVRL